MDEDHNVTITIPREHTRDFANLIRNHANDAPASLRSHLENEIRNLEQREQVTGAGGGGGSER